VVHRYKQCGAKRTIVHLETITRTVGKSDNFMYLMIGLVGLMTVFYLRIVYEKGN